MTMHEQSHDIHAYIKNRSQTTDHRQQITDNRSHTVKVEAYSSVTFTKGVLCCDSVTTSI